MAAEPVVTRTPSTLVDFFELTKPRVMILLLVTMVGAMVWAEGGLPPLWLLASALLGMGLTTGGASAINHALDRDLDRRMERTRDRPVAAERLEPRAAIFFGIVLSVLGVAVLFALTTPLAALMGLIGNVFYVVVYTMWLKRRTPQNIVIGGAAGAFPPMIGWAAVTGDVSVASVVLFLLIFFWTPPHFWALALFRSGDYAKAGVPMLPVVAGAAATKRQMLIYTLILLPLSLAPFSLGTAGGWYAAGALCLSALFILSALRVLGSNDDRPAKQMFGFSILYLFALFALLIVDRAG